MDERDVGLAENHHIRLRTSINLGDVVVDGADIYGDGVNIAARPEALAEPGGVCDSSIVHESLGSRVAARFADGGLVKSKNIDRPIRVFRWRPGHAVAPLVPAEARAENTIAFEDDLARPRVVALYSQGLQPVPELFA